jgi:hypothetical protein
VTLAEFLHPIRQAGKGEQVVATLYFFKHITGRGSASPAEVKQALADAQIPRARGANISQALADRVPLVNKLSFGEWEITGTGEGHVREKLALATPTPQAQEDVSSLQKLSASVGDENVREYIDEAVKCLQVGARRAAVVFLWSGAVNTIREWLWSKGAQQVDAALKHHNPKARDFTKKDDFSYVKDMALLEITVDLGLFDKSEKQQLEQALTLRNHSGHPVNYKPGESKVSSFIEDISSIVFGAKS